MPSKNYGDRFNDLFIEKRMKFLNKYLFSLSSNKIIKSSFIFHEFLTLEEEAYNAKKKEYYKKIKAPIKLSEMRNIEGNVILNLK